MGSCFSKNNTIPSLPTTSQQQSDLKSNQKNPNNEQQQFIKKEIFVIKHRISHEIDRLPDENGPNLLNPSAVAGNHGGNKVRASSCSKEEVDAILIQCGRLSRSNSAGAENPSRRRRRRSGSKRSFDFDLNMGLKNDDDDDGGDDDDDEGLNHHHRRRHRQQGSRVSSPSSRRSSRERDFRQQRSGSNGGRRISISPSRRRSESPISNSGAGAAGASANGGAGAGAAVNSGCSIRPIKMVPVPATDKSNNAAANGGVGAAVNGGGSIRPMKMVPVPATDKSNIAGGEQAAGGGGGGVKRIHVKRNVSRSSSPARTNLRIFSDDNSEEHWRQETDTRVADQSSYKRKSLAEIDNNAARSVQPKMAAMVENLKLNQNVKSTRIFRQSEDLDMDPSPPSYASLLLEDIHNFHQKNTNSATASAIQPPFSLPECVSKACSIMEAVADLNSTTATATAASSSLFSDDRWRKPVVNGGLMEPSLQNYVTMRRGGSGSVTTEEQESSDNNSLTSSQRLNRKSPSVEPNSANPKTRKCEMNPLEDFQSKLLDRPRKGIGRGRKSAYPTPEITTVALT